MPSASRRRAAEKLAEKKQQGKEWKTSSKTVSVSSMATSSAYNPSSGTFHMLDSVVEPNVKPRALDDSSSLGAASEYDSVSNNGSCSGESEDQLQGLGKEKACIPGLEASPDKQEKIRIKNERKHLRQKERRAKELKDRSTNYLMSRKLESLAQQLVPMGFPLERATMALILNEGHVEKSITFLLEDGERLKDIQKTECTLKIDISEELARIADLEIRFKYPRAEIERAIVTCEGDIDQALKWLQEHHPSVPEADATKQPRMQERNSSTPPQATKPMGLVMNRQREEREPAGRIHPQPFGTGVTQKSVAGVKASPARSPPVWQRAVPSQVVKDKISHSVAAGGREPATRVHESIQQLPIESTSNWRNFHPSEPPTNENAKRLDEAFFSLSVDHRVDALHFKPEAVPVTNFHNHIPIPLGQQGNPIWRSWNSATGSDSSDEWNVKAFGSIDYQSIDWSTGMPLSRSLKLSNGNFGWGTSSSSMLNHHGLHRPESMKTGHGELPELSDLVSQEWTTPFAELQQQQCRRLGFLKESIS